MFGKGFIKILLILILLSLNQFNAQVCGGSFGAPIFTEDFGSVSSSFQTVSPALQSPAFTNYTYSSIFPPDDGEYTIANSTEYSAWGWQKSTDHTADAIGRYGNMLVVNASYTSGEFYRRRVSNLCSNQVYRFSAWILNIHRQGANLIKPNVTFQIRNTSGLVLGSVSTGDLPEEATEKWKNFYLDFKSDPLSSDVDVVLINNADGGMGNDLAIDDISFSPCGPSTSVAATIGNVFTTGICDNSQSFELEAKINANAFQNINYIWQKSTDGGFSWIDLTSATTDPVLKIFAGTYQNNDKYRFVVGESININISTCRVFSDVSTVKINGYPSAPAAHIFNLCQNSSDNTLSVTGNDLLWYTSITGGLGSVSAPNINTANLGTYNYWVSQTTNGCESARTKITVNIIPNPNPPNVSDVEYCQNSTAVALSAIGTNLLWYTSVNGGVGSTIAPIPDTSKVGAFSFWVSQNNGTCESARAEIKVKVLAAPHSDILQDTSICDGEKITLKVESGFVAEWQTVPPVVNQNYLEVIKPGQYSVKLTDSNGCTAVQTVNVTPGITPIITQVKSGENFLEIFAENGNPPYLYSLDNVNWQTSNIFYNLSAKIYQVYVKSQTNSCTAIAQSAVLFIPNVFTPNQDSFNDVWRVSNIEYFNKAQLKIFDRYGSEVFFTDDISKFNWDGFSKGRLLPTGTYWYVIKIEGNQTRTGWVLLKNVK
jgi:gliding motility-associated-like protein